MSKVKMEVIAAEITKIDDINDRITYYEFSVDLKYGLTYVPGQFLMLIMPNDPRPVRRAYSIASTPNEISKGLLKLCITAVEGGKVSNWIRTKKVGETVEFKAPYGKFVLPETLPPEIHYISVGTGIVPFRCMIIDLFEKGCDTDIYLYHGNRHENSILYDEEFKEIAAQHSNFHYFPCISRPTDNWQGDKGYVQNKVKEVLTTAGDRSFYICGVNAMIEEVCDYLLSIGHEKEQIHYEKYD